MKKTIPMLILLPFLILSGCGEEATEKEVLDAQCSSDLCWELSRTPLLKVNDIPVSDRLNRKELHGWRLPTTSGHTYTVLVKVASGRVHTYVSSSPLIDGRNNVLTDRYSDDGVTFIADGRDYFIALKETGNDLGSRYTIRIVSHDANLDPLNATLPLFVNDFPQFFRLVQNETLRFMFHGIRGEDYTVHAATDQGSVKTFVSHIPSVDGDVFELAGIGANTRLSFRAAGTGTVYVAVVETGTPLGADFSIGISSP